MLSFHVNLRSLPIRKKRGLGWERPRRRIRMRGIHYSRVGSVNNFTCQIGGGASGKKRRLAESYLRHKNRWKRKGKQRAEGVKESKADSTKESLTGAAKGEDAHYAGASLLQGSLARREAQRAIGKKLGDQPLLSREGKHFVGCPKTIGNLGEKETKKRPRIVDRGPSFSRSSHASLHVRFSPKLRIEKGKETPVKRPRGRSVGEIVRGTNSKNWVAKNRKKDKETKRPPLYGLPSSSKKDT